jgi:hypothetical protein
MGLMTFAGNRPHLQDALIAKNYLNEKELRSLGQIVLRYSEVEKAYLDTLKVLEDKIENRINS